MRICLGERSEDTVKIYFEKAKNPIIKEALPQKAQTVEEALQDYRKSLLPDARSYGKTILVDEKYIGDIWCYCINRNDEPNAMLSYCIFDHQYWSKGIAEKAIAAFLQDIKRKYGFRTIGAFTFASNVASIRVLEKNGFSVKEEFVEDGRESKYLQYMF